MPPFTVGVNLDKKNLLFSEQILSCQSRLHFKGLSHPEMQMEIIIYFRKSQEAFTRGGGGGGGEGGLLGLIW